MSQQKDFCTNCRKDTEYTWGKRSYEKEINGKTYTFTITVANCCECGEEMPIPGLLDYNVREFEKQYIEKKLEKN